MKEQLNEKLTVQQAVKDVMENHISKWHHVAALKSHYDRFVLNLKKIENYQLVLEEDLKPMKEKRKLAKDQLIERVFPISSALTVYASDVGDRKLKNLLKGKLREIKKLSSAELVKYGNKVLETTRKLMEIHPKTGKREATHPVGDYGLTEQVLLKLQTALETYLDAINEYVEATINRKKCQVKLVKRVRENDVLLQKKMDHMIHLFRDSQKAFYNAYLASRLYVPAASGEAEKPEEKAKEAATAKKKSPSAVKRKPASAKPASSKKGSAKPASAKPASVKPASASTSPSKPVSGQPLPSADESEKPAAG